MKSIGYVYNRAAAVLRSSATGLVALVIPDILNPYYAELVTGVQSALDPRDESVFLANTSDDVARQRRLFERLLELQVDGVIVCPARSTTRSDLRPLELAGIPIVTILNRVQNSPFDYVGPDNVSCGRVAADHMIALGHREIAFVGGEPGSSARTDRVRGVEQVLARVGLDLVARPECRATRAAATEVVERMLREDATVTGIIGYNDVVALGVMDGLFRTGIEPGAVCSVIGFDDIQEAAQVRPGLTTVACRPADLAKKAVEQLARVAERSNDTRPEEVLLPGALVVRESTDYPKAERSG